MCVCVCECVKRHQHRQCILQSTRILLLAVLLYITNKTAMQHRYEIEGDKWVAVEWTRVCSQICYTRTWTQTQTHASETFAGNQHRKFSARFESMCHTAWRQIFTGACFWSWIKTALFLCRKPAGTTFSDWLTAFSASTVWDFWIWRSTWDLREIATHLVNFRGTLNNKT